MAIVGGGITGLTLAYELSKKGVEVLLLEKNPQTGGQAGTIPLGDCRLEKFYHHLFTGDTDVLGLIKEVSLAGEIVWKQPKMGIYYPGGNFPFGTPLELLKFSPLSFTQRLRFGITTLYLQKCCHWEKWENQPAQEWIRNWAGNRIYQVIWGPLLESKFGNRAPQISLAWFGTKIKLRGESRSLWGREKLGYLKGSFQLLIDQLEREIKKRRGIILVNTMVTRISFSKSRKFSLRVLLPEQIPPDSQTKTFLPGERKIRNDKEGEFLADRVVVTAALPLFVKLIPQLPSDYCCQLRRIGYQSNITLLLRLSQPLTSFYWLNISDPQFPFVGLIEHTNLLSPEDYGNQHWIYLSRYLSAEEELYHLPAENIFHQFLPFLTRINSQFRETWVKEYYVFREEFAQPVITRNYSQQKPSPITPIEGLYLANTSQIYPEDRGINYSVRLARQVAQLILSQNQSSE